MRTYIKTREDKRTQRNEEKKKKRKKGNRIPISIVDVLLGAWKEQCCAGWQSCVIIT